MGRASDYPPRLAGLTVPDGGTILRYGPDPDQYGELWPARGGPVVVLLHGGYWRSRYRLDLMHALAADLQRHGCAVWNLEYRRVGGSGGGWPGTFSDVAAGLDTLADLAAHHDLDLTRVAVVGHSAGGQLGLWSAARARPAQDPGEGPRVRPALVVALAPVSDLVLAHERGLSDDAAAGLLGVSYAQDPGRYRRASPIELLPMGVRQIVVHGTADDAVPFDMSVRYCAKARASGDDCELVDLPGADHFDLIDPESPAWRVVRHRLLAELGG
jgi:acetyl esterase/lipase